MKRSDLPPQTLSKEVTLAREMAILGDYESSIIKFKEIFTTIHTNVKKHEQSISVSGSGMGSRYANPTASSQKKLGRKNDQSED